MCNYMRLSNIRNEVFRDKMEVASVEDKMRELDLDSLVIIEKEYKCARVEM